MSDHLPPEGERKFPLQKTIDIAHTQVPKMKTDRWTVWSQKRWREYYNNNPKRRKDIIKKSWKVPVELTCAYCGKRIYKVMIKDSRNGGKKESREWGMAHIDESEEALKVCRFIKGISKGARV